MLVQNEPMKCTPLLSSNHFLSWTSNGLQIIIQAKAQAYRSQAWVMGQHQGAKHLPVNPVITGCLQ
ncbi:hypothetical protein FRX31_025751 [Thalictrum thalictroides]|uniref:Uncharacterized protein n=1 Tax=Thalictrum thalictroides TaxID=46969 RepID=A0A7J6VK18_THATH|nr:hypothetical protein FRX31_025751 [Thalictrum thalictroides]